MHRRKFSDTERQTIHYHAYFAVTCQNAKRHSSKKPLFKWCCCHSVASAEKKIVLYANITLKTQVLCSNVLHADFYLHCISDTKSEQTICGMIWMIRGTKPVANGSGHSFFCSGHYKEISDLRTLGWPIQFSGTFSDIPRSRIITR